MRGTTAALWKPSESVHKLSGWWAQKHEDTGSVPPSCDQRWMLGVRLQKQETRQYLGLTCFLYVCLCIIQVEHGTRVIPARPGYDYLKCILSIFILFFFIKRYNGKYKYNAKEDHKM